MAASKSDKATGSQAPSDKPKADAPAKRAAKPKAPAQSKSKASAAKSPKVKAAPKKKVAPVKEQLIADDAAPRQVRSSDNATERGDLFFFYRPDVDDETPRDLVDIRRLHLVLRPEAGDMIRLITIGKKTLPDSGPSGGNHWAFVDRVFHAPEELKESLSGTTYQTETVGERHLPEARPAGEGVYAIVRHGRDSVLVYALELPEELGEVQEAFGIERQGRFIISIKNPGVASPAGLGLEPEQQGKLPDELQELFGARRWHPADPPALLNHQGIEMILIGGRVEPDADLGIDLEPQPEDEQQAEVFRDLHLDRSDRTIRPLFEGKWA